MVGSFPATWRILPLEDCMEVIIDYRGKTPRKTSFGIPLITAKIVKNGRIEEPDEFIDPDDYPDWMRRGLPQQGDVIVTTEAPLGEVAQLDERKVALAQRLITLRAKTSLLNSTFLKFLMQSAFVQEQLKARATGTTVLGIKQSELRKVLLVVPPLNEQHAIATILGTLDDKIELNRGMNRTLETMTRAVFKSWFGVFDPVRAKAEGYDPALPDHIAKLFPQECEESELGEIPKGWRIAYLPEVFEINPPRNLRKGESAPYLDMGNMPTDSARAIEVYEREFGSGMRFINGDTLVARITPCLENGKTCFVDFLDNGQVGWGSTEYIILRAKPPLPLEYSYFLARTSSFRAFAISNMTGTSGRQRVSADAFDHLQVVVPLAKIAQRFGHMAQVILGKIKANDEQSKSIATTRDTLLPKLISGAIQVKDAEAIIGRAV